MDKVTRRCPQTATTTTRFFLSFSFLRSSSSFSLFFFFLTLLIFILLLRPCNCARQGHWTNDRADINTNTKPLSNILSQQPLTHSVKQTIASVSLETSWLPFVCVETCSYLPMISHSLDPRGWVVFLTVPWIWVHPTSRFSDLSSLFSASLLPTFVDDTQINGSAFTCILY